MITTSLNCTPKPESETGYPFWRPQENASLYTTIEKQKREIEALNGTLEKQVETFKTQAIKDKLTGLNNFCFFEETIAARVNEFNRNPEEPLAIAILEVDHFIKFNDAYGHQVGNVVLQEVARLISQYLRKMDIACRYGGEEFVLVMPKCELEKAVMVGERIREHIEERQIETEEHEVSVTISMVWPPACLGKHP